MDNKKLIGTILGVIAFVALIAGATFAWLTVTATVSNQYTAKSKNFIINYTRVADISSLLQLKNPTASQVTSGATTVKASKTANDAPASSFKLTFNMTKNTFATDSVIYAVCKSTDCPTTALATVTASNITCGTGVTCGKITHGSTDAVEILNDTTTFNTDAAVSEVTYNIYFWIDSEILSDADMNVTGGAQINGNVSASATQVG